MTIANKPEYAIASEYVQPEDLWEINGVVNNLTTAITVDGDDVTFAGAINLGSAAMTAGAGITTGTGTVYTPTVYQIGRVVKTELYIDLTGLNSSTAGDIIGKQATAASHFGQITAAVNGTVIRGRFSCLETPAGGEPDIDVKT